MRSTGVGNEERKIGETRKKRDEKSSPPDVLMGSVRNQVTKVTIRITGVRWAIHSPFFPQRCAGSNPARDKAFLVISVGIAVTV